MNSTWLITSELANQRARKALFTCVVYTKMAYLDAKKETSGLLLFIDFEKAFDSLEWDFRNKALNAFNFGPNVKRWITIFYKGVQSAVMNGGF